MNMQSPRGRPPLVVIAGPTASGKSVLAASFAERHRGTVINADSAQVYADLRVLTARPDPDEEARVPHRLFGHVDGADGHSAADWAGAARAAIDETRQAGRIPVLVGGTGLYLRTLIDGIAPVPPIDPDVRAQVRAMPVADAHAALIREDAAAAARLNPNDATRIARALEVVRSTGRTLSEWQRERTGGIGDAVRLVPVILLPDREWLVERCGQRLSAMVEHGALEEVAALLQRDLPADAPILRAIGVPEFSAYLSGSTTLAEATSAAALSTRRYAKRQYTWFRNQPPGFWPRLTETCLTDQLTILESYYNNGG